MGKKGKKKSPNEKPREPASETSSESRQQQATRQEQPRQERQQARLQAPETLQHGQPMAQQQQQGISERPQAWGFGRGREHQQPRRTERPGAQGRGQSLPQQQQQQGRPEGPQTQGRGQPVTQQQPQQQKLPQTLQQGEPMAQQQQQQEQSQGPQMQRSHGQSQQETAVAVRRQGERSMLSTAMQEMYLEQIPRKVGSKGGTEGRKIVVETNMFRLNFPSNFQANVVHYDVTITPDKPKFLLRAVFNEFKKKHFPKRAPAFDGRKNAYSAGYLPFGDESVEDEVTVFDNEFMKDRTFKIFMKKAALLDLSWLRNMPHAHSVIKPDAQQACIQALDIILKHQPAQNFVSVGRSIFQPPEPGRVISLSSGLDLWFGTFQSVVVGSRPYLNVDVAHKGFPTPQSVINLMKELCKDARYGTASQDITPRDIQQHKDKITKYLKGLKVQYEIPRQPTTKRTYRVNGLVECARLNKFQLEDGTQCSVEQYFSQAKNYKIQYPDIPCLWVGSRNSKIYLPAELCTITAGQVIQKKMDDVQTSNMIKVAATGTRIRKEKILRGFATMDLNKQPTVSNEFHLSVQGEFEKVPARVLQAPSLQYLNQPNVNVFKGTWRVNKFLQACQLPENSWTILNLDRNVRERDLHDDLHCKLLEGGRVLNMNIGRAQTPFGNLTVQGNISKIKEYFEEKKKQNILLVIVIIPNVDNAYSLVKQISELRIPGGIVTQCIKSQTLRKLRDSTISNILLKINSKLNGVNHTFAKTHRPLCLNVPCMIVGADVTHPSPDATDIPSIAAVAASHDPNVFQFNIELRLQSPREEMIQDLEEIMISQLKFFYTKTGYKPRKIIFYRDGVSDGQLAQVMHYELSAIKKAIMRLENSTERKIAITFLVVQKRHHTRFFPTDERNSDDKCINVQAGTIVDTEITNPTNIDFYLVSHASIQGTARPTKYKCICDENKMSEDEIERLTYYLCHMFSRCTRSVSYPAPTYNAHLAAFRARALIHNVPLNINNLQEEQRRNMCLQLNKTSPMFFV